MKEYLAFNESLRESLKPFQQAQHMMQITRTSSLNVSLKEIFHHVRQPYLLKERRCKLKLDIINGGNSTTYIFGIFDVTVPSRSSLVSLSRLDVIFH